MERKVFDNSLALEISGNENPSEIICQQQKITEIGDLSEVLSIRKIDLSFNPLTSLNKIDQLNQLRHLSAYCCYINDINCLIGIKRIETIMLQQNGITSIPFGISFQKLRELRLDRNQLVSVEPLSTCSSLRKLNISWNNITTFEGLSGLQNLQELSASHNSITSLKHLRALPSLIEIDVSYNQLKDLQGLQLIPTIEVLHAEHNQISTLVIPQTFFTHLNKELDKGNDKNSSKGEKTISRVNSASSSISNSTTASTNNSKRILKAESKDLGKGKNIKGKGGGSINGSVNGDQKDSEVSSEATPVGLRNLTELYLSENKITSLKGIDAYGTSLDILDLTYNNLQDSPETIVTSLSTFTSLTELKLLEGNTHLSRSLVNPNNISRPGSNTSRKNSVSSNSISSSSIPISQAIQLVFPTLSRLDNEVIIQSGKKKNNSRKKSTSTAFHTWEDGQSIASGQDTIKRQESKVSEYGDDEDNDDNNIEEDNDIEEDDEDIEQKNNSDEEIEKPIQRNPLLVVSNVLTREEIEIKETVFRGLLEKSKSRLIEAVKAFVPPVDPSLEEEVEVVKIDDKVKIAKVEPPKVEQPEKKTVRSLKYKTKNEKNNLKSELVTKVDASSKSVTSTSSSNHINSRPNSQGSVKRRIGSTTIEANPITPRQNIGIGFDCRTQRSSIIPTEKSKDIISLEESAMIDDEKRISMGPLTGASEHSKYHLTPRQRREGLHSSEEVKKRDQNERDDESIQWEPGALNLNDVDKMVNQNQSLTTLDTAIDWQEIKEIKYEDEDDREEGDGEDMDEMSLYSPRYTPVTQAEYVLPPLSRESTGKNLKSFRVPSLQSFLSNTSIDQEEDEKLN